MNTIFKNIPALFTVIVWGATFVASKFILTNGVSPFVLMTFRFIVAYFILWVFCRQVLPIKFNRQELYFLLLGLTGGSLYFYCEYISLKYTSAVNVGLICALVPIFSTLILIIIRKIKINISYIIGSLVAFVGAFLVITKGDYNFEIYPFGDCVAFAASILWAIYTVILKLLGSELNPLLISRRLFFYALITIIPLVVIYSDLDEFCLFAEFNVLLPSLYLAVIASAVCIWLWNVSINLIGIIKTNNYLYFLPVVSLIASSIFYSDEISIFTIIGTFAIFIGVIISNKRTSFYDYIK